MIDSDDPFNLKVLGRYFNAHNAYKQGLLKVKNTPAPKKQKFPVDSFVKISENLGHTMRFFKNNRYARVEHTYAHAYGGDDVDSYSLLIQYNDKTWSSVAWYKENQLTLVTDKKIIKSLTKSIEDKK